MILIFELCKCSNDTFEYVLKNVGLDFSFQKRLAFYFIIEIMRSKLEFHFKEITAKLEGTNFFYINFFYTICQFKDHCVPVALRPLRPLNPCWHLRWRQKSTMKSGVGFPHRSFSSLPWVQIAMFGDIFPWTESNLLSLSRYIISWGSFHVCVARHSGLIRVKKCN